MKIQLKESELRNYIRNIITEEVDELDWRTYQSAADVASNASSKYGSDDRDWNEADKMMRRKSNYEKKHGIGSWDERIDRFHQKASDAFNDEYAYSSDDNGQERYHSHPGGANSMQTTSLLFDPSYKLDTFENEQWVDGLTRNYEDGSSMHRGNANVNHNKSVDNRSSAHRERQEKGDAEIRDYYSGKTKYKSGEGWTNESIKRMVRKAVSEAFRRY